MRAWGTEMSIALGVLLLAHGLAHMVGFVGSWRLSESVPCKTTLFGGRIPLGDSGLKVVGGLWLLAALAFAAAGVGSFIGASWWAVLTPAVSLVSLTMCVAAWPDAKIGAAVDAILIVVALTGASAG